MNKRQTAPNHPEERAAGLSRLTGSACENVPSERTSGTGALDSPPGEPASRSHGVHEAHDGRTLHRQLHPGEKCSPSRVVVLVLDHCDDSARAAQRARSKTTKPRNANFHSQASPFTFFTVAMLRTGRSSSGERPVDRHAHAFAQLTHRQFFGRHRRKPFISGEVSWVEFLPSPHSTFSSSRSQARAQRARRAIQFSERRRRRPRRRCRRRRRERRRRLAPSSPPPPSPPPTYPPLPPHSSPHENLVFVYVHAATRAASMRLSRAVEPRSWACVCVPSVEFCYWWACSTRGSP